MTLDNSQDQMYGRTSLMQRHTGKGRSPLAALQLSIPVRFLYGATFLNGLAVGLLIGIPTHHIALICGYVAALFVAILSVGWLESRARTVVEERDRLVAN